MATPRGANDLAAGQAIPETTVNEQIRHTEAGACHFPVVDKDLTSPPGSCADGANYVIAGSPSGLWTGKAGQIATALGANAANGWRYHEPIEGFTAYMQDENARYLYGGASWALDTTGGSFSAASTTEQLTGTDSAKGATPDSVAALWEQGSDVASAGTVSLGEGGYFNITGTTTITDIDFATDKAGRKAWVKFVGVLTLTHNASTLILPTAASITTAAGDTACFVSEGSDVVRCVAYQRASGAALSGGGTIGGSVGSTDNRLVRSDGTGGSTLQSTGITVDDNDKISLSGGGDLTPATTPSTTSIGYLGAPQNTQNDTYTTVMSDAGKHIYHTLGSTHTWTIDSNANVAYPIGTILTFINESGGGNVTIAITSDTLRWGASTGSRTLAANGVATAIKVASTTWRLTGDGIT